MHCYRRPSARATAPAPLRRAYAPFPRRYTVHKNPDRPAPTRVRALLSGYAVPSTLPVLLRRGSALLRDAQSVCHDEFRRVRRVGNEDTEALALGSGEITKDEVRGILSARWSSDANTHPQVILAECLGNVAETIVSAVSAAQFESHSIKREVEVVMDDDEPRGGQPIKLHQCRPRTTGHIHKAGDLCEHKRRPARREKPPGTPSRCLVCGESHAQPGGEFVAHHLADTVPIAGVLVTGVSQPANQPRLP